MSIVAAVHSTFIHRISMQAGVDCGPDEFRPCSPLLRLGRPLDSNALLLSPLRSLLA
jgi:hypothetical protein